MKTLKIALAKETVKKLLLESGNPLRLFAKMVNSKKVVGGSRKKKKSSRISKKNLPKANMKSGLRKRNGIRKRKIKAISQIQNFRKLKSIGKNGLVSRRKRRKQRVFKSRNRQTSSKLERKNRSGVTFMPNNTREIYFATT